MLSYGENMTLCAGDRCNYCTPCMLHTGRLKMQERTMRDQVAGVDNARTFGIDRSDKFRSHFVSVLVYCYLIFFCAGTYCFIRLSVNNGVIDKALRCSKTLSTTAGSIPKRPTWMSKIAHFYVKKRSIGPVQMAHVFLNV